MSELLLEYDEAVDLIEHGLATPHPIVRAPDAQTVQFAVEAINTTAALVTVGFSALQAGKVTARITARLRARRHSVLRIAARYKGATVREIQINPADERAAEELAAFIEDILNETERRST